MCRTWGTTPDGQGMVVDVATNKPYEGVADLGGADFLVTPLVLADSAPGVGRANNLVTATVVRAPQVGSRITDGDGEFQPNDGSEAAELDEDCTVIKKKHNPKGSSKACGKPRARTATS